MFNDGLLKSREIANMIKEKLIAYLCKVINESNVPENMPDNQLLQEAMIPLVQPVHQYKCYVGKGNNSILIRTLFKTRFWWLLHDKEEIEKVNFMWTQLRKNMIMDTFAAIGIATEPPSTDEADMNLEERRRKEDKIIQPGMWRNILIQTAYQFIIWQRLNYSKSIFKCSKY
jgi:hypothetical protein